MIATPDLGEYGYEVNFVTDKGDGASIGRIYFTQLGMSYFTVSDIVVPIN